MKSTSPPLPPQDSLELIRSKLSFSAVTLTVGEAMNTSAAALAEVPGVADPRAAAAQAAAYLKSQTAMEMFQDTVESSAADEEADDATEALVEEIMDAITIPARLDMPQAPRDTTDDDPAAEIDLHRRMEHLRTR